MWDRVQLTFEYNPEVISSDRAMSQYGDMRLGDLLLATIGKILPFGWSCTMKYVDDDYDQWKLDRLGKGIEDDAKNEAK